MEVALTEEQERRGLMFRKSIKPDCGMLFLYGSPRQASFWMRNTLIPLDMIFIRPDHTILRIASAEAYSTSPIRSGEPVIAVLEVNRGRCAELGIDGGDYVDWGN